MKKILFILLTIFTLNSFSQNKIVKIPQTELDGFFLAIDTLRHQDSLKTTLIKDYKLQITQLNNLNSKNDTILLNKDKEIVLLNDQIKLYSDRLKITDRWYNKRWFGIVVGVVGTSGVVYLAGQLD